MTIKILYTRYVLFEKTNRYKLGEIEKYFHKINNCAIHSSDYNHGSSNYGLWFVDNNESFVLGKTYLWCRYILNTKKWIFGEMSKVKNNTNDLFPEYYLNGSYNSCEYLIEYSGSIPGVGRVYDVFESSKYYYGDDRAVFVVRVLVG